MKKRDKSKTMDAKDTDIFAKRSGYIYTEYMTPAIYTTLSYDQKLTYIRQVFVSASATHPVYAKMLHLITGREIQEQYLDMLYDVSFGGPH
jgi:hypothetical protein